MLGWFRNSNHTLWKKSPSSSQQPHSLWVPSRKPVLGDSASVKEPAFTGETITINNVTVPQFIRRHPMWCSSLFTTHALWHTINLRLSICSLINACSQRQFTTLNRRCITATNLWSIVDPTTIARVANIAVTTTAGNSWENSRFLLCFSRPCHSMPTGLSPFWKAHPSWSAGMRLQAHSRAPSPSTMRSMSVAMARQSPCCSPMVASTDTERTMVPFRDQLLSAVNQAECR